MEPSIYFLVLSSLVVIWLAFFVFSKKDMPKVGLLLLGLSPSILIYVFNPDFRIYSFHGFMHSGIVYQLLNGTIPPDNPAFSGLPLHYPWGWHCVAALITKVFNITPFYSFAISNIVSLFLSMVLVYKISRLVIKNEKFFKFDSANFQIWKILYFLKVRKPTFKKYKIFQIWKFALAKLKNLSNLTVFIFC